MLNYKINKRGMFFTLLVVSMISLFVLTYSVYSIVKDRSSINKRLETLNEFNVLIDSDLPRHIYVSGYRIIYMFEKRITKYYYYIDDVNIRFNEAFFNGTIYDTASDEEIALMQGIRYKDIIDPNYIGSLNYYAKSINVYINFSNPKIYLSQDDPWRIKVTFTANLLIKDKGNLASWNRSVVAISYIPIDGNFEDPIYVVGTSGLVPNKINRSIYNNFVSGNNVTNLSLHLNNSYYISSTLAPSFLDRLEGKKDPNLNGIESFVNFKKLSDQGILVDSTKSCVDYLYFLDNHPQVYVIQGTNPALPSWFRIDDEGGRLSIYGVYGFANPV